MSFIKNIYVEVGTLHRVAEPVLRIEVHRALQDSVPQSPRIIIISLHLSSLCRSVQSTFYTKLQSNQ